MTFKTPSGKPASVNNSANLSYAKKLGDLNLKLNSDFDYKNKLNYLTNFEVSGKF